MESVERVDKQHDSFNEVDRILAIVEESKKDFDRVKNKEMVSMSVLALSVLVTSLFLLYVFVTSTSETDLLTLLIALLNGASNIILLRHSFVLYRKEQKRYDQSIMQAIETVREISPVLSHSESWSALKQIEVRLRLSKLDISPEGILDDRRP